MPRKCWKCTKCDLELDNPERRHQHLKDRHKDVYHKNIEVDKYFELLDVQPPTASASHASTHSYTTGLNKPGSSRFGSAYTRPRATIPPVAEPLPRAEHRPRRLQPLSLVPRVFTPPLADTLLRTGPLQLANPQPRSEYRPRRLQPLAGLKPRASPPTLAKPPSPASLIPRASPRPLTNPPPRAEHRPRRLEPLASPRQLIVRMPRVDPLPRGLQPIPSLIPRASPSPPLAGIPSLGAPPASATPPPATESLVSRFDPNEPGFECPNCWAKFNTVDECSEHMTKEHPQN